MRGTVQHSQGNVTCVLTFQWYRRACGERISLEPVRAVAHRHVVVHPALGSEAADTGARIHALVALAGLGPIAVSIDRTLWATALVRIAEELREARADSETIVLPALRIYTAFAREAGLLLWNRCRSCWNGKNTNLNICTFEAWAEKNPLF